MKLITSLFSILNFLASPLIDCAYAEESAHVISEDNELSIRSIQTKKKNTLITLSNGSIWRYEGNDLFLEDGWHVQDRIKLVHIFFEGYYLQNISYQGCAHVELMNRTSHDIQTRRITFISPEHDTIHLDDHSVWHIGWWSGIWTKSEDDNKGWQAGDRILLSPHQFIFGDANYLLINLDKPFSELVPSNARARLDSTPYRITDDPMRRENSTWPLCVSDVQRIENRSLVTLNDATSWLCEAACSFCVGDKVIFAPDALGKSELVLLNQASEQSTHCELNSLETNQMLSIRKVFKKGRKLELSDGSLWTIGWLNSWTTCDWNRGDHVLVSAREGMAVDTSTHRLINLERLTKTRKVVPVTYSDATLLR